MNKTNSEEILDFWAMVFGNSEVRELGKEKSEWFKKIYDALNNNEPGFLEFIISAELRYGNILAKEELIPTTSLLVIKFRKKSKEKRKNAIVGFFNEDNFDNYCKEIYYLIKESTKNGSN